MTTGKNMMQVNDATAKELQAQLVDARRLVRQLLSALRMVMDIPCVEQDCDMPVWDAAYKAIEDAEGQEAKTENS